jgi:hypothetical protein
MDGQQALQKLAPIKTFAGFGRDPLGSTGWSAPTSGT